MINRELHCVLERVTVTSVYPSEKSFASNLSNVLTQDTVPLFCSLTLLSVILHFSGDSDECFFSALALHSKTNQIVQYSERIGRTAHNGVLKYNFCIFHFYRTGYSEVQAGNIGTESYGCIT